MNPVSRIRLYHSALATLSLLAYITGEAGLIHAWLGYGVAIVITLRLALALSGDRNVGLMRFYPSTVGLQINNIMTHPIISRTLILLIAICVLSVTLTGIIIDRGEAIGLGGAEFITAAQAEDEHEEAQPGDDEEDILIEIHELSGNLMLLLVGVHVAYLFTFKRPLAKFMLFIPK